MVPEDMNTVVGVATVVLAIATLAYVILTKQLANRAADSAAAAERAADAAERAVMLDLVPIVVPAVARGPGSRTVHLLNAGKQAAFDITLIAGPARDDDPAPRMPVQQEASLAPGERTSPVVSGRRLEEVHYRDPFGNHYRVEILPDTSGQIADLHLFHKREGRWERMQFEL